MSTDDRIQRARAVYERAVFGGDISALLDAAQGLDAVEAHAALARGLILHARFRARRSCCLARLGGTCPRGGHVRRRPGFSRRRSAG